MFIVYLQGAALIRMLANVMGQPAFQRGLNVSQSFLSFCFCLSSFLFMVTQLLYTADI